MDRADRDTDADRLFEPLSCDGAPPEGLLPLCRAATSRLLASVAHDVRSAVASIAYSADFLETRGAEIEGELWQETVRDIGAASRRLQLTVDGLLDYAHLGPTVVVPVPLHEVLNRAQGVLRSFVRDGAPRLRVELARGADWVRGNPVTIEQIFVNLLVCCAEHAGANDVVVLGATVPSPGGIVEVSGVCAGRELAPVGARSTTGSVHVALHDALAATTSQGGELRVDTNGAGFAFTLQLPRSEGPR